MFLHYTASEGEVNEAGAWEISEEEMVGIPRLVVNGEAAVYHVMSRTALDEFVLGALEKNASHPCDAHRTFQRPAGTPPRLIPLLGPRAEIGRKNK